METIRAQTTQHGFFDAGLSLGLMAALSLLTAVLVSNETAETQQQLASCTVADDHSGRPCNEA